MLPPSSWPAAPSALWALSVLLALLSVGVCWLGAVSPASAADYTWSAGGGAGANAWSNPANWLGGMAPAAGSSIGTLTFPLLPVPSVAANDLSGLSINRLSIDDTSEYALNGQGFTLGSGGLSVSETAPGGREHADIYNPITLASSQTWDISGRAKPGDTTEVGGLQAVEVTGALSGEASNLTVNLHNPNIWFILGNTHPAPDNELGNVKIIGSGASQFDEFFLDSDLNATDGHSLTVEDSSFATEHATGPLVGIDAVLSPGEKSSVGPLTSIGSRLEMGNALDLPSASFDADSTIRFGIISAGTQAGTDYSQLTSSGALNLGDSTLELNGLAATIHSGTCPTPTIGQVDTLIATTGTLTGTFGNAADGATVTTNECLNQGPGGEITGETKLSFRINYNLGASPETVTATALPTVPVNTEPPTIAGAMVAGQTLSESHGVWANNPTSYGYQWQRCDSAGNNCQPITGTTAQNYTLSAADVGSTLRVQETASNSEGVSSPATSEPTAVIQAGSADKVEPPNKPPLVVPCCDGPPLNPGTIKALLIRQLTPSAKSAKIGALLKSGGLTMNFTALEAGTLTVQWFSLPTGAKLAKHTKPKPVLVASGKLTFAGAGTGSVKIRLTSAGKHLLKHVRLLKLTTKSAFTPNGAVPVSATKGIVLRH